MLNKLLFTIVFIYKVSFLTEYIYTYAYIKLHKICFACR